MNLRLILFLLIICIIPGCQPDTEQSFEWLKLDPETEYQNIYGFGLSIVNYKDFPPEYYDDHFIDMVVNDLGMSILRIPITEQLEYLNDDKDPDHFNWDGFCMSDNHQRKGLAETMEIVTAFKEKGINLFMASPWSPPAFMKTNRAPIQGGFLRSDMYKEFAEYLAAYIILVKHNWDVDINWISLQNECIFIEFYRSCLYHGYGMKEALKAVMDRFDRENINSGILINEDILVPERVHAFLEPVFDDPVTRNYNGDIAVHRQAKGDELVQWNELTKDFDRDYWMTETSGHDTSWGGALEMVKDMHEYLVLGNFSTWIYWQISGNTGGSNPGLYTLMLEGKPTCKYYAAKHFYRYIRPGAVRIDASSGSGDLLVSAYKHKEEGTLTVVIINPSDNPVTIMLENNHFIPGRFSVNQSTEKELFISTGKYRKGDLLTIPKRSIVSLVGENRNLREKEYVTPFKESWNDVLAAEGKLGNFREYPIESEWQGATDAHIGRLIQAENAVNSGHMDKQRYDGWSLMHEAILNGDGDAVSYLIMNGANVNITAKDGWTPLHAAASGFVGNRGIQMKNKEYTNYELFRMVLEAGGDVKAVTTDGWTPLHCAVANAYTGWRQPESTAINRITDLIRAGADLEAKDINGRTPLHWAAMQGYSHYINEQTTIESDIVEMLIDAGAKVNVIDSFGRTPLHYAVEMGYGPISCTLVENNANVYIADAENKSPIDIAHENQSAYLIYILENKKLPEGSDEGIAGISTDEAVHDLDQELVGAAVSGDEEQVKQLLSKGADIYYKDRDGFRAIDRARDNGNNPVVELLIEAENQYRSN